MDIYAQHIKQVLKLISDASDLAREYYHKNQYNVFIKPDRSEVTDADHEISNLITQGLAKITPSIPVISEEMDESAGIKIATSSKKFWLIDPIDGTKCFIEKSGRFTVNIALIDSGTPVLGFISEPILGEIYYTDENNRAICSSKGVKKYISCKDSEDSGLDVAISIRNKDGIRNIAPIDLKIDNIFYVSSSYKFCMVADGRVDLYPQFGKTCTWDIAAGEALVNASGGIVTSMYGKKMQYVRDVFDNPPFFAMNNRARMLIDSFDYTGIME